MIIDTNENHTKKSITFEDKGYFTGPRFLIYFTLIVLSILLSIYIIEMVIGLGDMFFVKVSLLISGFYVLAFIHRIKKIMP